MESRFEKRAVYVRDKVDYYMDKFSKIQMSGDKVSWNWAAFFFTSYWLIYRKMYKLFAIVAALEIFIIPAVAELITPLGYLTFATNILLGLFGNYLYMNNIDQLIDNEPAGDMMAVTDYQNKNGGTTYYVWIYLGVAALISSLLPFN